jgi:hypothetical protein
VRAQFFDEKKEWVVDEDGRTVLTYPLEEVPVEVLAQWATKSGLMQQDASFKDLSPEVKDKITEFFSSKVFGTEDFGKFVMDHVNDGTLSADEIADVQSGETESKTNDPESVDVIDQAHEEDSLDRGDAGASGSQLAGSIKKEYAGAFKALASRELTKEGKMQLGDELAAGDRFAWQALEKHVAHRVPYVLRSHVIRDVINPIRLDIVQES